MPKTIVFEDAPGALRIAFINSILEPLTFEPQYQEKNPEGRPLESFPLIKQFCSTVRQEIPDFPRRTTSWTDLKDTLIGTEWFNFYDFVECVGKMLKIAEQNAFPDLPEHFTFATFRTNLNELFVDERIGWRLNDKSELERQISQFLAKRIAATDAALADKFDPARRHYQKAIQYTLGTQTDPENAIKEVSSAIESVGKIFYEDTKTLGDVVKEMKKDKMWPTQLVLMIEKYYAYASSEPAVRHGSAVSSRVLPSDAEFCLHVGAAIIRYLIDRGPESPIF